MRKTVLPLALVVAMGAAGAAMADETTAMVTAVDSGRMIVALDDGHIYSFDTSTMGDKSTIDSVLIGLKAGNKVHVVWTDIDGSRVAESISPVDN